MKSLIKISLKQGRKFLRRHAPAGNRPVCGGGRAGANTAWQEDIGEPNCGRCAAILNPPKKQTTEPTAL